MTTEDFDALERDLLTLGKREHSLESALLTLRRRSRHSGLAKDFEDSDKSWSLHEEMQIELAGVKSKISSIEARLYSSHRIRK